MASVEFITKRVAGKEKEIEKLTKKLERIHKAEATNWEVNPYYYTESDLKYTTRDLQNAKEALVKLNEELAEANKKADSRNVPAITEFLEKWKEHMRDYYHKAHKQYLVALHDYSEQERQLDWFRYRGEERKRVKAEWDKIRREFHERWGFIESYVCGSRFDDEKFERDIKNEADRKYDFIIERTVAITGKITDASGLYVGAVGDLNGHIIGEEGVANVQTIGAGGYNIQCFHFRTLIHAVK